MRLSDLQKYILRESHTTGRYKRNRRSKYYLEKKKKSKKDPFVDSDSGAEQQKAITKSLERLIDKELMIGFGRRTSHKWFIDEIKLTGKGKKAARKLLGEQQRFPFRLRKKNTKS